MTASHHHGWILVGSLLFGDGTGKNRMIPVFWRKWDLNLGKYVISENGPERKGEATQAARQFGSIHFSFPA
jgi:hypothetical protein